MEAWKLALPAALFGTSPLTCFQLVAYGSLLVRQDKASHKADQAVNALKDVGHRAADKVCRGGKVVCTRLGLL